MSEKKEEPMIYTIMAMVLKECGSVSKDRKSVGKFTFAYRGIDDVMNALHEAFATHGLFLTQNVLSHDMSLIEGRGIHHIMKVEFIFWTMDGSSIKSTVMGECIENGDKGTGKCMSYALKTCLLQTFLIPTEDESKDPDSTNQPIVGSRVHQAAHQAATAARIPQKVVSHDAPQVDALKASIIKILQTEGYDWLLKTGKSKEYLIDKTRNETDIGKLNSFWATIQKLIAAES